MVVENGVIQDAGNFVKGFDPTGKAVTDAQRQDFLHCDLAPSFGKLTFESVQKLDDELKTMIAGVTKQIEASKERSWQNIVDLCAQTPFLTPFDSGGYVNDSLLKESTSAFKTNGSPADSIVQEVEKWFKGKINDPDVLTSTKIDINALGRIVAQSGATVDSFGGFLSKSERRSKTILDIGVLRYPDFDNPYLKIYRIHVTAWSDSSRTLFQQQDRNGIKLEFDSRKYKVRSSVISGLQASARQSAIDFANDLFS